MFPTAAAPAPQAPPPAAPAPEPVVQPVEHPQEPVHVQGTPHPGVMTLPGVDAQQAAAQAAAIQRAADAAATQLPPGVGPEQANVASRTAAVNAREIAQAMGFADAARFQNDQQFMEAVLAQAQAGAQAQAQLQAIQQHQAAAYQAQAAAQQAQLAQQQAQTAQPRRNPIWNPPEYDPQWETMVTRDPATGAIAAVPGIPQEIASKLMAYRAYRQQFAERFMADPEATLLPLIEQTARSQAQEMIRSELQNQQNSQYIEQFVATNSSWLHQTDNSGQLVTNPQTGRPVLSPAGARFQQHVIAAANAGVTDVRQQEAFARTALQNDILRSQYQYAQGQQAAQQSVTAANRRPNVGGMIPQPGVPAPPATGMSLQQQLALAMHQAGVTDAMIDANLG